MAAEFGHTIAVVNKSGKVISTSKHLLGVFKEAKAAYQERKAEIVAERQEKQREKQARRAMEALTLADETRSQRSERSHHSRRHHHTKHRGPELIATLPPGEHHRSRGSMDRGSRSPSQSPTSPTASRSLHHGPQLISPPEDRPNMALARRHTTQDLAVAPRRQVPVRTTSAPAIDMDLAYGEYHPKSLQAYAPPANDGQELNNLVAKAKALLEEADCAHASITAVIAHLQKKPEAMAAVALTLAEISNIAAKMAPGAVGAIKGLAPAVFALLISPEFLIAAGVGVGITVVMLGGYKIIKRIRAKGELEKEGSMDEMVELDPGVDLNRIENWRRGIADIDMGSAAGTSVEGEFITPIAAQMRRRSEPMAMAVPAAAPSRVDDLKSRKSSKSKSKKRSSSKTRSERSGSSHGSSQGSKEKKTLKVKKPSPLRLMFS